MNYQIVQKYYQIVQVIDYKKLASGVFNCIRCRFCGFTVVVVVVVVVRNKSNKRCHICGRIKFPQKYLAERKKSSIFAADL